jgi:hypothetical protein
MRVQIPVPGSPLCRSRAVSFPLASLREGRGDSDDAWRIASPVHEVGEVLGRPAEGVGPGVRDKSGLWKTCLASSLGCFALPLSPAGCSKRRAQRITKTRKRNRRSFGPPRPPRPIDRHWRWVGNCLMRCTPRRHSAGKGAGQDTPAKSPCARAKMQAKPARWEGGKGGLQIVKSPH